MTETIWDTVVLLDKTHVEGIVYKLTNDANDRVYIGQTRTHIFNHGKFRPAGITHRLRQHFTIAKTKPSMPISMAIKEIGEEHFHIAEVARCSLARLDGVESAHITLNDSVDTGYNESYGCPNDDGQSGKRKRGKAQHRGEKRAKRAKDYAEKCYEVATIAQVGGCAPKYTVTLSNAGDTSREADRTTFSAVGGIGRKEAMDFAKCHAKTVRWASTLTRGEIFRQGLVAKYQDTAISLRVSRCKNLLIAHIKTPCKHTVRTMERTSFQAKPDFPTAYASMKKFAEDLKVPVTYVGGALKHPEEPDATTSLPPGCREPSVVSQQRTQALVDKFTGKVRRLVVRRGKTDLVTYLEISEGVPVYKMAKRSFYGSTDWNKAYRLVEQFAKDLQTTCYYGDTELITS